MLAVVKFRVAKIINGSKKLIVVKMFHLKILNILFYYSSFISDTSYREAVENSVNHNTRLCIERRLRMPFLDTQTGMINNSTHHIYMFFLIMYHLVFIFYIRFIFSFTYF